MIYNEQEVIFYDMPCSLSLETVFNTFHSVLLGAEFARARQRTATGNTSLQIKQSYPLHSTPEVNQL